MMNNFQKTIVGVILGAGRGTRMVPFSNKIPKPILPICNKPLMEYHIEMMRDAGARDIFVVIGHQGHEIARVIGDGDRLGVHVQYVEQIEMLGIAHALGQLEPYIKSPFILFLGDIFFHTNGFVDAVSLFRSAEGGSFLLVKEEPNQEAIKRNFAVIVDPNTGQVRRVIEKPRYIRNNLKGCGLYFFDLSIFDAVRRTPRTALRDEYELTEAIQILIDDGNPVQIAKVVEEDVNLTFPYDLLKCNLYELDRRRLDRLIHPTAKVDPRAKIIRSVVGPRVTISGPIILRNSLVLEDTTITQDGGVTSDTIITPDEVIDCSQAPILN